MSNPQGKNRGDCIAAQGRRSWRDRYWWGFLVWWWACGFITAWLIAERVYA